MNFDHNSLNDVFGFPKYQKIPYVCIDNPIDSILKARYTMSNSDHE